MPKLGSLSLTEASCLSGKVHSETQGHLPERVWAWRQEVRFSWPEPSCPGAYVRLVCVPVSLVGSRHWGWLPEAKWGWAKWG